MRKINLTNIILIASLSLIISSCATIKFSSSPLKPQSGDWLVPGGTPERNNISLSNQELRVKLNELWNYNTDAGFPVYSVTVSDYLAFVSTLEGKIYAFDILNGTKAGSISVKAKSLSSAPIINGNELLFSTNGPENNYLYSFNMIKGEENWMLPINRSETAPVFKEGRIYLATVEGELICVNTNDSTFIWNSKKNNRNEIFNAYYSSPALSGDKIFIGNDNGCLYGFDIRTGNIINKIKTDSKINSDISIFNNRVIFSNNNGELYCTDTTLDIIWRSVTGYKVLSSFTNYNETIFVPTVEGKLLMVNIMDGKVEKELSTAGTIKAPPLLHNGKIYIGSYDKYFYCFDAATGDLLWRKKFDGRIGSSAVVWENYLLIPCEDRYIYCFQ
ncbi:MAG: PQQ-binding-like beta-propeller repeat protein [Ignavibacteria bacterium]|nr:PQQ-binding-like beta-propeller repeat protein [Ignavibacteria bacterium]